MLASGARAKWTMVFSAAMLAAWPVFAPSAAWSRNGGCKDPIDQTSMNICAGQAFDAADRKLNEAYQALGAKVSDADAARLKKAQRAWIAYRDAQCDFETAGTRGGSVHAMVVARCRTVLTQEQAKHLIGQLHCQEGDLSCGGQ